MFRKCAACLPASWEYGFAVCSIGMRGGGSIGLGEKDRLTQRGMSDTLQSLNGYKRILIHNKTHRESTMKKLLMVLAVATAATSGIAASFKFVAIPDTQNLAEFTPAAMTGQAQWVANNVATESIAFVSYLGDIVNDGDDLTQWGNATAAIGLLDGVLPYSVCMGNHDLIDRTNRLAGAQEYIDRFGSSRYSGYSWYKGSFRELNHYQIFNADGRDWLHINLESDTV